MSAVKQSLIELGKYLKKELQKELLFQKHKASAKLLNSIDITVDQMVDKIVLEESHLFYGDFVDRGRKPGQGSGDTSGKFQIALEKWVRIKGFSSNPKEIKSIAFAIRRKIWLEGIPTSGGKTIAPRRKNWLTGTIERNTDKIEAAIEPAILTDLNVIIDDILARTNAEINAQG